MRWEVARGGFCTAEFALIKAQRKRICILHRLQLNSTHCRSQLPNTWASATPICVSWKARHSYPASSCKSKAWTSVSHFHWVTFPGSAASNVRRGPADPQAARGGRQPCQGRGGSQRSSHAVLDFSPEIWRGLTHWLEPLYRMQLCWRYQISSFLPVALHQCFS